MNKQISPEKKEVIKALSGIALICKLRPDLLAVSALLYAIIGASIVNKDEEFAVEVKPFILKMLTEVEAELSESDGERRIGMEGVDDELDDFFDKNEFIS